MKITSIVLVLLLLFPVLAKPKKAAPKPAPFTSLMDTSCWKPTRAFEGIERWSFRDGVFEGSDGWIGHNAMLVDFVLEGDFLYNGKSQGGVVVRGDRNAWFPNLSGYEMDIDADMPGSGHISFPFRPQPNPGIVPFPVNAWQHFSIAAHGRDFTVELGGKEVIRFRDDHYRYGQICLEGERDGLKYKNLKVQKLDGDSVKGLRSPWTELFNGGDMNGWASSGNAAVNNGAMEIDGGKRSSSITNKGISLTKGIFEFDVWCKRPDQSLAPYRIAFRNGVDSSQACFTCRPGCVLSCGSGKCVSPFPMFEATKWSEFWRFEVMDKNVSAFRFGEKVMDCSGSLAAVKAVSISADSCVLLVRGVRYKSIEKPVTKKKRRNGTL
ncbi:MAG TPA: DUF1080 domain-containing protein [Chitinivibrionales bacterium]|nr:DUF1080 domain-containing protein [Chitinivibrionales bacterium]